MTTFKQYIDKHRGKIPSIETVFGSHSEEKGGKTPSISTSFGKHSTKEKISEKVEIPEGHQKNMYSAAQEEAIHESIAPLHDDRMSPDEKKTVKTYSDESYPYNRLLHRHDKGSMTSTPNFDAHKKVIGHMDSLLEKHKTTSDMHVFTGIEFSPAKHFKRVDGKVPTSTKMHMPAFTSTSTSLRAAREFSQETSHPNDDRHGVNSEVEEKRHVLKIHVPAGSHAMSLMKHSFVPSEKEVVLHRGHTIEVHHEPEKIDDNTYMWHAKIVDHKKADLSKDNE